MKVFCGLKGTVLLAIWLLVGAAMPAMAQRDTLLQVSTIDALLSGLYDGTTTIGALQAGGDFGIGTFDGLNGEMVLVDGNVFRVRSDGVAELVAPDETTPFAAVTWFEEDRRIKVPAGMDFSAFKQWLDDRLPSLNQFYALRIEGRFLAMKTRSVPRQHKPYPPLAEVAKHQPEFEFSHVEGVVVGFRSPAFVKGIGVPGYHLHFLTADRKAGGHILAFTVDKAQLRIDQTDAFLLRLPQTADFSGVDLRRDRSAELHRVEQGDGHP